MPSKQAKCLKKYPCFDFIFNNDTKRLKSLIFYECVQNNDFYSDVAVVLLYVEEYQFWEAVETY